jgi:glycosyltransferase involved in cell wall biosynthesis
MRILIATDAFPPVCGGSGWSTYELARGLRTRNHHVVIVQPDRGRTSNPPAYDGFDVIGFPVPAPPVPFVRNYFRNERLYPRLSAFLQQIIVRERIDLVHGQHLLTGPASIRAARAAGVPSVCTVRDYWPMCYWSDLTKDAGAGGLCPACSASAMTDCVRPHAGPTWPLALPWIPYMRANLLMKQQDLARADVVIAVSESVATRLRARVPELASTRIEAIPNAVDVARVRDAAGRSSRLLPEPYALFVGKLAFNKGVAGLVDVLVRAQIDIPLIVAGDGPDRGRLVEAATRANVDLRGVGWLDRDRVFQWLQHASLLVFPSGWQEPLSRVLLEASALGVPIAAMDTGGTSEIIVHGETGLLSRTVDGLAADVRRLAEDEALRVGLGAAAARRAASLFDVPVILDRMERLYRDILPGVEGRDQESSRDAHRD